MELQTIFADVLINVQPMKQRLEAKSNLEDWTGVTSTAQRRKLQNRLNQRAYRRRKENSQKVFVTGKDHANISLEDGPRLTEEQKKICQSLYRQKRTLALAFEQQAAAEYLQGTYNISRLPTLLSVNVFNAISRNAAALGMPTELLECDAFSPFYQRQSALGPSGMAYHNILPDACPLSLRPTALQMAIPHHTWMDLFPIPQLRDNLLLALTQLTLSKEEALCFDMVEIGDGTGINKPAIIVWGEPWDPRSWEVSIPFLKKWGWLLKGCPELIESTNYWRAQRRERRIVYNVG